ncbi:hypothetical protein F5Y15DRAFT_412730 [Xylariaceae sp. FL0016]|nr:hypothetical protein F5Y15DRAFT_412730 [Xylariaceae sp. FL0016]
MFATRSPVFALAASILLSGTWAYNDNCKGSTLHPNINNCMWAMENNIDQGATYSDGQEFSFQDCYIKYATNGSGAQSISGADIYQTCRTIIEACGFAHGSYGTGNCDECHVTMNYRLS